ncbi:hypothetical protein HMSSN139_10610 [Paenibacillus sp. HMSSN-139]|nr:hypothetical protein HMSSN139_10610 [Paenibacillus sp. HMSSN-139]
MFAALRTGTGNKYLAYGEMLPPLPLDAGRLTLDWFHYNHGIGSLEYNDAGSLSVERIVHAVWKYRDESVGLFFANVSEEAREVAFCTGDLPVTGSVMELRYHMYSPGPERREPETVKADAQELKLTIPPRCVVLLEALLHPVNRTREE